MKSSILTHILLAVLTLLAMTFHENLFVLPWLPADKILFLIQEEILYSVGLFVILFAHEMGHYVPSRIYNVRATLPYFIPMPFGPIGTMGAVIKIKDEIPDKKKLFDIGAGGPLMSLILSLPCWIYGIYHSKLVKFTGMENPERILIFGDSLFTYFTSQWILGPYDTGLFDVSIHPLARAGWVGLIITAINLLPFGQLDGGHVIYSMFGEKYRSWIYYLFLGFLLLGFVNFTWIFWGFLIFYLIRVEHPFVSDAKLDLKRKLLGGFLLFSLAFIFVPVPMTSLAELKDQNLLEFLVYKMYSLVGR